MLLQNTTSHNDASLNVEFHTVRVSKQNNSKNHKRQKTSMSQFVNVTKRKIYVN